MPGGHAVSDIAGGNAGPCYSAPRFSFVADGESLTRDGDHTPLFGVDASRFWLAQAKQPPTMSGSRMQWQLDELKAQR